MRSFNRDKKMSSLDIALISIEVGPNLIIKISLQPLASCPSIT